MARFDLSDAEWRIIAPLLPNKPRRAPRTDDRRVINAIFYVLRTGSPWRDLPERDGPHTTAYDYYNRWAKSGAWLRIFEALAERSPQSMALIDSSIIRAHQHAAGGKKGSGSRHRPFSWRTAHRGINAVVDGAGLPIRVMLTPGQASDKEAVAVLIKNLTRTRDLVADRGHDARALIDLAAARGTGAHIPTSKHPGESGAACVHGKSSSDGWFVLPLQLLSPLRMNTLLSATAGT